MTRKRHLRPAIILLSLLVAIFALSVPASAEWKEKVLYSFQGIPDGSLPGGGVVFDKAGNLYGVTAEGGSGTCAPAQCGIVYQLSPPEQKGGAWTETVLYVFKGQKYGDGSSPAGTLLIDSSGNLYGGTGYGGTGPCTLLGGTVGCGTVYELSPPKEKGGAWTEKVLYSFKGGKDGQLAAETLTFDANGNIFGATTYGGGYGSCNAPYYQHCGTVYELSPPKTQGGKWTEKVLYSFKGVKDSQQSGDGANPNGGLALDSKGAIYGTTFIGGYNCPHHSEQGCGTAFELKPPNSKGGSWIENQLHIFKDGQDGAGPNGDLVFDTKGNVYGTTVGGGPGQFGTVFRLMLPAAGSGYWIEEILYGFSDDESGAGPMAGLVLDVHGVAYGTTAVATNTTAQGNVFRMKPPATMGGAWAFSVLYTFKGRSDGNSDGASPAANLVFSKGGTLFSTTRGGGAGQVCQGGCGTVFKVSP